MRHRLLLIVGERVDGELLDLVSDAGYAAVFTRSLCEALRQVRDGRIAAVVADFRSRCGDALEFALNVRDLRDSIPLLVIGPCDEGPTTQLVENRPGTRLVGADATQPALMAALSSLLPACETSAGRSGAPRPGPGGTKPRRTRRMSTCSGRSRGGTAGTGNAGGAD